MMTTKKMTSASVVSSLWRQPRVFPSGNQPVPFFLFFGKNWINKGSCRRVSAHAHTLRACIWKFIEEFSACWRCSNRRPLISSGRETKSAPLQVFFIGPSRFVCASPACDFVYGAKTNNKQHKREIWYSVNNTRRRERECSRRLHRQFIRRFIALQKRKFASQQRERAVATWLGLAEQRETFVFVSLSFAN